MLTLLAALTAFYLFSSAGALATGLRLVTPEGRRFFFSQRLRTIALTLCFTYPAAAAAGQGAAWWLYLHSGPHAAMAALAPLLWLMAMGALFAVVDVVEDGVFDFGRGPN